MGCGSSAVTSNPSPPPLPSSDERESFFVPIQPLTPSLASTSSSSMSSGVNLNGRQYSNADSSDVSLSAKEAFHIHYATCSMQLPDPLAAMGLHRRRNVSLVIKKDDTSRNPLKYVAKEIIHNLSRTSSNVSSADETPTVGPATPQRIKGDREAQILQKCHGHPCIPQLEEFFCTPQHLRQLDNPETEAGPSPTCILVMEHIEGAPWGTSFMAHRKIPDPFASHTLNAIQGILRDLLLALHHLHDVVSCTHNDIKPENIIVRPGTHKVYSPTEQDNVGLFAKLIDFGCAMESPAGGTTLRTPGTYYYCSPEKVIASSGVRDYCPRKADVWALGISAAVAIYGNPDVPFPNVRNRESLKMLICRQGFELPPAIGSRKGDVVPKELMEVMKGMLHPNPDLRPTALQLLQLPFFTMKF